MRAFFIISLLAVQPFAQLFCCCVLAGDEGHCAVVEQEQPSCHASTQEKSSEEHEVRFERKCDCHQTSPTAVEQSQTQELRAPVAMVLSVETDDYRWYARLAEVTNRSYAQKCYWPPGPSRSVLSCFLI
ncbi:MAG: hypothetical protein KDC35_04990 [Acidobacteria bacterium]|nr:hypothetical protein [Acidobacteriota bacterium]